MIYPNLESADFCNWMLTISSKRLSGPQTTLVQLIQSAALSGTSVTLVQWNNFQNFTAWRFALYQVYINNQLNLAPKNNNVFVQNWLDRLSTAGFSAPSYKTLTRLNLAFNYAQQFNLIDEIDFLWLSVVDDINHSLIPLLSTNTNQCTIIGTPDFTPNIGLSGSLGCYVKTNWIESVDAVKWALDNAIIGSIANNDTNIVAFAGGVYDTSVSGLTAIAPSYLSLTAYVFVNGVSATSSHCDTAKGLTLGLRNTIGSISMLKGSCKIISSTYSTNQLSTIEDYILAYNLDGTPQAQYSDTIQLWARSSANVDTMQLSTFYQMLVTPLN